QHLIPVLLKIEVHINDPEISTENYDLILMTEFESINHLNLYINHPEHQKMDSFISKVKTHRAAIDYVL
ncbi:MAG: Dabb family protein, partial [Dysgonamonadaceae bacterium]